MVEMEMKHLYVCGGGCGVTVDHVERFDPRTSHWELLPPMHIPRRACALASAGGKLYVMGGVDVQRVEAARALHKCSPECFDPVMGTWKLLSPMSRPHTHAAAACVCGRLIGDSSFHVPMTGSKHSGEHLCR